MFQTRKPPKKKLGFFSAFFLILFLIPTLINQVSIGENVSEHSFYVGVSFCGNTTAEAKMLIDRVQNYTNLFILQSGPISKNESAVNEISDYAVEAGLSLIVYFGWFDTQCPWQLPWLDYAKQQYGNKFLGVYYYDEPAGIQIDYDWPHYFDYLKNNYENATLYQAHAFEIESFINGSFPKNYDQAAQVYVDMIKHNSGLQELKQRSITAFTSEYALPWFDYLGGWDVVFIQLGWNFSVAKSLGLIRGAATVQGKSWGSIITWKYDDEPYLDSGEAIYDQMVKSYEAGAQYIVVFNYPSIKGNPYGVLFEEHFEALELFWNNAVEKKEIAWDSTKAEIAIVLPSNYGWAMRNPKDRIWYWGPDEYSISIWNRLKELLSENAYKLDIVYEDQRFPLGDMYDQVFYWNSNY
jgi:hypothetical protein